jgi:signal transduction histidine kinase
MIWAWFSKIHPRIIDVGLAALVVPISIGQAGPHSIGARFWFAVLMAAPLLVRRQRPVLVLGLVLALTVAGELVFHHTIDAPATLGVYTVAAHCRRGVSLRAGAFALLVLLVPLPGWEQWGPPIPAVAAWLLGDNLRTRRAYLRELEARAERLEREREENARRAAAEEQARIARELHDVLAHNVSVMVVQATAANDVFDTHPDKARDALRSIEQTGRSALTELRRLLGAVRTPTEDAYAPQPGLSALDGLVGQVQSAGLPVAVHVQGDVGDLPVGLDLSAYRIVQEALTNALKHSGATRVEIGIRRTPDGVELEIVDDGVGGPVESGGQGLIGMRERASLVGGEVEAGPQPDGGFRVRARLPLGQEQPA